ncbi:hypothetical protein SK128_019176 [Halocaridina rubra]|uniref:Uncharacterized protein n=1 Tax=Halocaridina rubra TaxID=373956 RepID=A0AAN8X864_HALRR
MLKQMLYNLRVQSFHLWTRRAPMKNSSKELIADIMHNGGSKQVAVEESDILKRIRIILGGNIQELVCKKVADDVEDAAHDTKRSDEFKRDQG